MAQFNQKPNRKAPRMEKKNKRPEFEYEIQVTRVLRGEYGTIFDLVLNHVTIYGCRVCETQDGTPFVGFPQKPDRRIRGKYWSIAYAPLTDAQTKEVFKQISRIIKEQDKEEEDMEEEEEEEE